MLKRDLGETRPRTSWSRRSERCGATCWPAWPPPSCSSAVSEAGATGGVIGEILARDGDRVEAGDVLVFGLKSPRRLRGRRPIRRRAAHKQRRGSPKTTAEVRRQWRQRADRQDGRVVAPQPTRLGETAW